MNRPAVSTCGMLTVSTVTTATFSCRQWLCSISSRSASGVVSMSRVRKTATPGTRTTGGLCAASPSRNSSNGPSWAIRLRVTIACPRRQLIITIDITSPMANDSHAPCSTLATLELKNATSTVRNSAASESQLRFRRAPEQASDGDEQQRVEDERPGHRHAVDVAQLGRGTEHEGQRDHAYAQRPVDHGHVDLALDPRGVQDPEARQEPELHRLLGHRERTRDRRLRGDHRRDGGEHHQRPQRPARRHLVEGIEGGGAGECRVVEDERALAQVVEHQRGQRQARTSRGGSDAAPKWPRSA